MGFQDLAFVDAIIISLFSMLVVFVVLLLISYIIDLVAFILNRKKDTEDALPAQSGPDRLTEKTAMAGAKADDKTAAIIAAAVTTYLGQDRNFVIKKIERNGKSRS